MTASGLAGIARAVFRGGPVLVRTLQHWRPYICPFEVLLPPVPAGARVLDIGCGGGLFGALVCSTRSPARFIGFDSSRDAIAMAQANVARMGASAGQAGCVPEFVRLGVEEAWPVGEFDVVAMIDVAHHIPPAHQRAVLEQAASRVEPGGVFIYKDMTRRGVVRPMMNRLHDLALARQWIHYVDPSDVKAWMAAAGMSLVHESYHTRWWYGHELMVFAKTA
ncbi:MAG: class I SAM-dependent methyltransferase [Phycisphaerales bacterium]|nr:class I SAM-dependent methyltransferase [Phycisphaerales bacterium]